MKAQFIYSGTVLNTYAGDNWDGQGGTVQDFRNLMEGKTVTMKFFIDYDLLPSLDNIDATNGGWQQVGCFGINEHSSNLIMEDEGHEQVFVTADGGIWLIENTIRKGYVSMSTPVNRIKFGWESEGSTEMDEYTNFDWYDGKQLTGISERFYQDGSSYVWKMINFTGTIKSYLDAPSSFRFSD